MDRKQTVIAISVAMAFMVGWYFLVGYVERTYGPADAGKQSQTPTNVPAAPPGAPGTQPTMGATTATSSQTTAATTGMQVLSTGDSRLPVQVNLGSAERNNEQFALMLRTTAAGAGLDSVVLNRFLESVDDPKKQPYVFQHAHPAVLQQFGNALATRTITVDGQSVNVSGVNWTLETQDQRSATYSVTLGTPGQPVLKVFKTYRVFERNGKDHPGGGYEIRLDYDFENLAGRPLQVSMGYNGPAMPPRELDNGPDQRVMAGYGTPTSLIVENHYVETFSDEETTRELVVDEDKKLPAYWVGASSIYFQGIIMPPLLDSNGTKTPSVQSFRGIGMSPDKGDRQPLALVADTAAMTVPAGQRLNYPIYVYFGPKHREVLEQPFYASLPRDYDQTLVVRAGPCAMCTFDWLINLLVWMLGAFHMIVRDWGLAIIALVVLVRLLLHPITKRSQVSMMKMGKMGPEIERLRKKHGDNKEELQKAMWQLQKQQGITPILGCLPMFLQMPIWIALWSALNTTFELRHSNFLWGFTWIDDLAKPDRLIPFGTSFTIPLIGHVDAFNILPILLAGVFYVQMKLQPKPPTMSKEQEQQQKIMQGMMVFLFPLFLYSQPSGLNLYILASTGIGIWESKRIRQHVKEKEEAEKAGVVIVDAEPAAATGPSGKGGKGGKKDVRPLNTGGKGKGATPEAPTPTGWLARKLAEFQKKAEELQRETERKRGRDRA